MNKFFGTKSAAAAMAAAITGVATVGAVIATATPAWADTNGTTTTVASTTTTTAQTTTTVPASTTVPIPAHVANRLAWVKKDSDILVKRRVEALNDAQAYVQKQSYLGADQALLVTKLQAQVAGLQALDAKIQGDTDLKTALADRSQIFSDFRVYLLTLPVVKDVSTVDWYVNFKVPATNSQITQLQGQENSSNQSVLGPLVSGMQSQVGVITTATNGLSAQLIGFTPAQWNSNHKLLWNANADIRITQKAMSVAEHDYTLAERYLRSGHLAPVSKHNHHRK